MKLDLRSHNGIYSFELRTANGSRVFSSNAHYFLVPGVQPYYKFPWRAYRVASQIMRKRPYHVAEGPSYYGQDDPGVKVDPISSEEMFSDHYKQVLLTIKERINDLDNDKESKDERDEIYQTVKMVEGELDFLDEQIDDEKQKRIIISLKNRFRGMKKKYFPAEVAKEAAEKKKQEEEQAQMAEDMSAQQNIGAPMGGPMGAPPAAPPMGAMPLTASICRKASLDKESKRELLEDYGENACKAISDRIKECLYRVKGNSVIIYSKDSNGNEDKLLKVTTNHSSSVNGVFPLGMLARRFPFHSTEFYQLFWKPITESVGHYFVDDQNLLIVPAMHALPDVPKASPLSMDVRGWSPDDKKEKIVSLSIRGKVDPVWFFTDKRTEKTAATTEEMEYLNATVECTDPEQKSLQGRIGEVEQVIPLSSFPYMLLDINFGRKIVRLPKDKVKIVSK